MCDKLGNLVRIDPDICRVLHNKVYIFRLTRHEHLQLKRVHMAIEVDLKVIKVYINDLVVLDENLLNLELT